jgi:hypothetical protein
MNFKTLCFTPFYAILYHFTQSYAEKIYIIVLGLVRFVDNWPWTSIVHGQKLSILHGHFFQKKFLLENSKVKSSDSMKFEILKIKIVHVLPGKDYTPWVYALYRVNKCVLTRKIGQFRVTLRDITP